jgi:serine/threonine protein kinase
MRSMPDWLGKTIGKVRIENLLAQGGMAEVYLGTHITLERPVAIKLLHSFIEEEPILLDRFHREAKVVAGLRHPNIVQVFDFDSTDGHPYIVMEYLKGPTLAKYLEHLHQRKKRIPPEQVARLLKGLTAALDYAHGQGVIHRDIKPGNILLHNKTDEIPLDKPLADDVEPILTDFGLVRVMSAATLTASGFISGTPAYMSPEQARGDPIDHRTDIYSLGTVLYEMLAGRIPFVADNTVAVLHMHIHTPPPPISGLSPAIQAVTNRALAKNPKDRYQTSQEMSSDFNRAIGLAAMPIKTASMPAPISTVSAQKPVEAFVASPPEPTPPKPVPLGPRPKRSLSRLWIGLGLVSLVLFSALVVGALLVLPNLRKPTQALSPVIPNTATSPLPTATSDLPSKEGMVQIPAGVYEVGTTLYTDEYHVGPQQVSLESFWIDQYQTTNAEYQEFMAQTNAPPPEVWPGDGDHPVRGVTWDQAVAYCKWAKKQLPSEAEWEAAGRGSDPAPQIYPWGNDETADGQALSLPDEDTYSVGTLSFNKSPFGVFDMVGNVWEWVGEPYANLQEGYKIIRGGRFGLPVLDLAYRFPIASVDTRYVKYTGFRCAADQVR